MTTMTTAPAKVSEKDIKKFSPAAQKTIQDSSKKADVKPEKSNVKPSKEKVIPEPRVTKKSVVIEFLSKESGATIEEMAKAMVERKIDPDLDKNKRVVRLWLPKIGFKIKRNEEGRYLKA